MAGNSQQVEQDPDVREPEDWWIDLGCTIGGYVIVPGLIIAFVIYVLWKLFR